jgi:uncharacterized membrane protein HdeD (DUF308 family)
MAQNDAAAARQASGMWWWFIVTGILWLILSVVVLRFDVTSIAAVGALMGVVFVFAAANEFATAMARPGWKWLHVLLGILFICGGFWGLIHPIEAFWALASVLGLLLILKGIMDISVSVMTKQDNELWWLGLTVGIMEILLAFWVSIPDSFYQNASRRALLAMFRGIGEIVLAFHLHKLGKALG